VNGLKVLVEQGNIASHWSTSWRQYYLSAIRWPCHLDMTASFSMSAAPQVDADTCVVNFKGTPELNVTGGDDFLSACNITPLQITDAISGSLQPLASLQLMQLDTFALANLVFPSGHKVRLTSAKLPQDLILQGTMVVPLTVQPDRVSLTPGRPSNSASRAANRSAGLFSLRAGARSAIRDSTLPPRRCRKLRSSPSTRSAPKI
jgi:hypothetical protein